MSAARLKCCARAMPQKTRSGCSTFPRLALGIGFLIVGVIYTMIVSRSQEVSTQFLIMVTVAPGAAGYYLPQYWVQRRLQARRPRSSRASPTRLT